ncbi:MAG: 4-hydroxy-tetrahydrodipicolinate reductase [Bacteroidales bacterium]|nr:4-hydroxy-tetrahydrodipicolinate reductase [Bacteroidales bacterium]
MKIGIAGYGRMGHEVESVALERGHAVTLKLNIDNAGEVTGGDFRGTDVVIEFTAPGAAPEVISMILKEGVPVVSGTTGWLSRYNEVSSMALASDTAFIHASNYSPGVYMLSRLNSLLASYMNRVGGYNVAIEEIHHTTKLDAPSGTAIMLADQIIRNNDSWMRWSAGNIQTPHEIPVNSVREGNVPGTHHIRWQSGIDAITLSHEAFSRRGFALGAVIAAEYIAGKKGIFTLEEIFGF